MAYFYSAMQHFLSFFPHTTITAISTVLPKFFPNTDTFFLTLQHTLCHSIETTTPSKTYPTQHPQTNASKSTQKPPQCPTATTSPTHANVTPTRFSRTHTMHLLKGLARSTRVPAPTPTLISLIATRTTPPPLPPPPKTTTNTTTSNQPHITTPPLPTPKTPTQRHGVTSTV